MAGSLFGLLARRRFWPLFVTQFLGAANDNLFKNALVILILFRLADAAGLNGQIMVTAAAGIFILPFFLFSATAGQLADKLDKARLIQWVKLGEIAVMALGALALAAGDAWGLLGVLFLMGVQSAFFGPLKYSILPDHLGADELLGGNALVEAGTFLAILLGTIAGGLLILAERGVEIVSAAILGLAVLGWLASRFIPPAPAPAPSLRVNLNFLTETWAVVAGAGQWRAVRLSILGISWFWLVGATFLSQFPALARDILGADETVVTLFLTVFSVGIGLGSLLCHRLLKGDVSARHVPLAAIAMSLFMVDLYYAAAAADGIADGPGLRGAAAFMAGAGAWRLIADLLGLAIAGGVYIVPLYAIMQSRGEAAHRSRTVAANNIVNALFMVAGAALSVALLAQGYAVTDVFLVLAALNGVVAVYICGLLPETVIKGLVRGLLRLLYRVQMRGAENYLSAGGRVVAVVNHVSFLDGLLLAAFLPGMPTFAVDTGIARKWWARPFLALVEAFPVDPANPMATKAMIKMVREGRQCVIFPEGRITVTGALMKVYEGPGMIADKADAALVPIRIEGAQYSPFSRLRGKVHIRWFPKILITVLPPQRFQIPDGVVGRARRRLVGTRLYDVMTEMIFKTCNAERSLFEALLEARALHGRGHVVLDDVDRGQVTYNHLLLAALAIGRRLSALTGRGERVGLLLPNMAGTAITFFALQAFGRVPAMLNFTAGLANMRAAIAAAEIKLVLTSRRFAEMAKLDATLAALDVGVVYLEDLRASIGFGRRLAAVLARPLAGWAHRRLKIKPGDPAVVLFTSGSEGTPKGVVLSHANLLANRYQLASRIDFNPSDIVFNALPLFHSFGLTGGLLLPLLAGVRIFLYPSPLHYRVVPTLVYETNATILFGTDTFLAGYARVAHPYDFYSLRYVFAGAERVREATRQAWSDQFGVRILEGYGATETAPVLAANTPMHFKAGTVGRLMPGIEHRIEPVEGIERGGRLLVRGPNVMLGYLLAEAPGKLQPPAGGEYDTGDIVDIDDDGFITILGRAKRFAKVAGEMVSLPAIENLAAGLWPGCAHAAVGLPDPRKGERLVLVTEKPEATRDALLAHARAQGVPELMVPRDIVAVDKLPLLGSGKVDYGAVGALAEGASASSK